MGHAQVMTAKVAWDNACYWGITALLFYPAAPARPGVHGVDRAADAPLLRAARAHAGVPPRVVASTISAGSAPDDQRRRARRRCACCRPALGGPRLESTRPAGAAGGRTSPGSSGSPRRGGGLAVDGGGAEMDVSSRWATSARSISAPSGRRCGSGAACGGARFAQVVVRGLAFGVPGSRSNYDPIANTNENATQRERER